MVMVHNDDGTTEFVLEDAEAAEAAVRVLIRDGWLLPRCACGAPMKDGVCSNPECELNALQ